MSWEAVIGLEVHVQLATATKMFCRCANLFGAEPNTLVCPVCLGYPGALPVTNPRAVELATKLALALGCTVRETSVFARKNYFYPDLPKGYQISQYDRPLAERGALPLSDDRREIRVHRLHLEEDAGKLLHESPDESRIDFNRCGVPLVEIVSEPDLHSAEEAQDYLQTLHQVLLFTETSDASMEEGSLRCDANVSVRRVGETRLGTKVEIKNLNSFRFVGRAIDFEIARQIELLESGEAVVQETRGFDENAGATHSQRSKEEAQDYRYFPDPDLLAVRLSAERIETLRATLPELPWERRRRYVAAYGLSSEDAAFLASQKPLGDYLDEVVALRPASARPAANWVRGPLLAQARERGQTIDQAPAPERLAALLDLVEAGKLSSGAAKDVVAELWAGDDEPAAIAERLGLTQVSDVELIESWVAGALEDNAAAVEQWRSGKSQALGFLVGQVMKRSGGRAEPRRVHDTLRRRLDQLATTSVLPPPAS
jgi:aspartyl-tRNA(Asn)/glutamyl-tRNA(Gln) amidotransferase subunit B